MASTDVIDDIPSMHMIKKISLIFVILIHSSLCQSYYSEPSLDFIAIEDLIKALDHLNDQTRTPNDRASCLMKIDLFLQNSFLEKSNPIIEVEPNTHIYEDVVHHILRNLSQIYTNDKNLIESYQGDVVSQLKELEDAFQIADSEARERIISKALIYLVSEKGFSFFDHVASYYVETGSYEKALRLFDYVRLYSFGFGHAKKLDRLELFSKMGYCYDKLGLQEKLNQLFLKNPWDLSSFDIASLPKNYKFKHLLSSLNKKSLYQDTLGKISPPHYFTYPSYQLSYESPTPSDGDTIQILNQERRVCKKEAWCLEDGNVFVNYLDVPTENRVYVLGQTCGSAVANLYLYVLNEKTGVILSKQSLGLASWYKSGYDMVYYENNIYILGDVFIKILYDGSIALVIDTPQTTEEILKQKLSPADYKNLFELNIDHYLHKCLAWRSCGLLTDIHVPKLFLPVVISRLFEISTQTLDIIALTNFSWYNNYAEGVLYGTQKLLEILSHEKHFERRQMLYEYISSYYSVLPQDLRNDFIQNLYALTELEKKTEANTKKVDPDIIWRSGTLTCENAAAVTFLFVSRTVRTVSNIRYTSPIICKDVETGMAYDVDILGFGIGLHGASEHLPSIYYEGYGPITGTFTGIQGALSVVFGGNGGVFTNGKMRLQYYALSGGLGASYSIFARMQVDQRTLESVTQRYSLSELLDYLSHLKK